MAAYALSIPSLAATFPNAIPQNLIQQYPAITRNIVAGSPHGATDASDAEAAAVILSNTPNIKPLIIDQARSIAATVRMEYAINSVLPANPILLQLVAGFPALAQLAANIQGLRNDITALGDRMDARFKNQHIMGHNNDFLATHQTGRSSFPVKQVTGDGTHRLLGLGFTLNVINNINTWQVPAAGPPHVGTRPPFLHQVLDPIYFSFTITQLCGLIKFYNEDFSIVAGDNLNLEIMNRKFRDWMTGY